MSFNRSHNRYLRHGFFKRDRHRRILNGFLSAQGLRLAATGHTLVNGAVAASGTLTNNGTNVSNGDTITIGTKVYTFQTALTNVDGNVLIGASNTASMTNLFNAINLGAGAGTTYAAATTANPAGTSATNPSGTTVVVTATLAGTGGNAIATTKSSTNSSWGAATLTGGANSNGNTVTAHGYHAVEGPFVLTTTGVLPSGLALATLYWVSIVDANTVRLYLSAAAAAAAVLANAITPTDGGSGTHTITRALTAEGIFDLMRFQRNRADTIMQQSSADSLK